MAHVRTSALAAAALLLAAHTAAAFPERLQLDLGGGQSLSLVLVHAGRFEQGSPGGEAGRGPDETPRTVSVTRDFYLGEVPVLRGQFARFADASRYRTEAENGRSGGYGLEGRALVQRPGFSWRAPGFAQTDEHPAVILTFDDAQRFTAWASTQTGRTVRLPTEAEWELACRAGTATPYYNGAGEAAGRAAGWFREGSGDGTRPVRGRAPNALGLHDMVGHVQQWVADWYAPYEPGAATDPLQLTAGSPPGEPARRVLRGGSWLRGVGSGRCAARSRATPGSRNADTGFRVAVDAAAPPPPPPPPAPRVSDAYPAPDPAPAYGAEPADDGIGAKAIGLGVAALAVGAFLTRRRWGAARQVRFVPQEDGFRIVAPPGYSGRVLRYRYSAGGQVHEQAVSLEYSGAGQFVYTGAPPSGLEVIALGAAMNGGSPSYDPPTFTTHHHHDSHQAHSFGNPDPPSSFFGRDPPAY